MKALSLAWRNLLRNRRRSFTTLLAMVIGLAAILLFGGYILGINQQLQTGYVQRSGHLQVQHTDYLSAGSANPAAYGVADPARLIALLKSDPQLAPLLRVATPVLQFSGIAGNFAAGVSRTVNVTGLVADEQKLLRSWNGHRLALPLRGLALAGMPEDSAIVGVGVARMLQLCQPLNVPRCGTPPAIATPASAVSAASLPSDVAELGLLAGEAAAGPDPARIEILATSARGSPNVAGVKVVTAEHQGVKDVDDMFVALHLSQAQQLIFGGAPPQATAVIVQLHHSAQMPQARARLNELLRTQLKDQPLVVQDFATLNPFYGQTTALLGAIFGFVAVLIVTIVLFTVGNTLSMVVIERTVEIGTLRAIGLRRSGIRALFLCEGLVLGLVGAAAGLLVALGLAWLINHSGLDWTPPGRAEPVPMAVRIAAPSAWISALAVVFISALSALWPAARAARMKIVEALRHA